MTIKLSKTKKMPAKSWSIPAIKTCPAAIDTETGGLVELCKDCYATKGFYNMPNVKDIREHNMKDWKRDEWEDEMVDLISEEKYFRWLDSGDMYTVKLATKFHNVIKRTSNCKHWLPTRMYKFNKFKDILGKINKLSNVALRLSSDSLKGAKINMKGFTTTTVVPKGTIAVKDAWLCPASNNNGKCGDCRVCWDKDITVAYIHH